MFKFKWFHSYTFKKALQMQHYSSRPSRRAQHWAATDTESSSMLRISWWHRCPIWLRYGDQDDVLVLRGQQQLKCTIITNQKHKNALNVMNAHEYTGQILKNRFKSLNGNNFDFYRNATLRVPAIIACVPYSPSPYHWVEFNFIWKLSLRYQIWQECTVYIFLLDE
jgi:hypothetical protein